MQRTRSLLPLLGERVGVRADFLLYLLGSAHSMIEIKGLIFDCDGTLAETMPLHWRAWQTITGRHGITFPEDRFYALGGVPSRDILRLLLAEQSIVLDPLIVRQVKEEEYLELM